MNFKFGYCLGIALQYLQHVQDAHVNERPPLGVVNLRSLDDDCVRGEIDSPGQSRGANQNFYVALEWRRMSWLINFFLKKIRQLGFI